MKAMQELAQQFLAFLEAQQAWQEFNPTYNAEQKGKLKLESKRQERELRARCEALVDTTRTPSLFDLDEEETRS